MAQKHDPALVPAAKELRQNMTKQERHLWFDFLRSYPVHFYRQRVLGKYIADFYCAEARLVLELDGSQHYDPEQAAYDAARMEFLRSFGLHVLRIPNNEIDKNFAGVCTYIDEVIKQRCSGENLSTADAVPLPYK